ncbi:MAG: hypothetical protein OIF51_10665 [Cellvibrionaceae bacterium]|nr:hypothetical protein [Cellvibrionaceae bacterium]
MKKGYSIKIAYWRGMLLAPLSILPATVLLAVILSILQFDAKDLLGNAKGLFAAMGTSILISIWGTLIAYLANMTLGTLTWYVLLRLGKLSLVSLLVCSVFPSVVFILTTGNILLSIMTAYYSLVVAFSIWFFGLRGSDAITRPSN